MSLTTRVDETTTSRTTIYLKGRLDTQTADAFDKQLEQIVGPGLGVLVIDLSGLEYMSSAGLRSIVNSRKSMKALGGRALVVNPQPRVMKVFEIAKMVELASVFTSLKELDDYLDAMQGKVGGSD